MIRGYFLRMIKSKKGSAIEMAMVTSIVVLSLCMILLTTTSIAASYKARNVKRFESSVELEYIGDTFVRIMNDKNSSNNNYEGLKTALGDYFEGDVDNKYTLNVNLDGNKTLTVREPKTSKFLMEILLEENEGSYTVKYWTYTETTD